MGTQEGGYWAGLESGKGCDPFSPGALDSVPLWLTGLRSTIDLKLLQEVFWGEILPFLLSPTGHQLHLQEAPPSGLPPLQTPRNLTGR
jgi:hypothetical protein